MTIKINTDGGARGNPGPAACAFVAYDEAGNLLEKRGKYLGTATNNEAEYQGVIEALTYLANNKHLISNINFFLDSQLVVNQLNGLFKVKEPRLRALLMKVRELESELTKSYKLQAISYEYVPREQNRVADALVNETLDKLAE
ncbi:MAG: ribonuclease HI family protein [Patescibacteria group bacterium]|nr:ribonuclease HI family protein [Patescibacteria group bacterium]MCL5431666.1 ribonuclease HI family protein [Patescibacteria group bacterium]